MEKHMFISEGFETGPWRAVSCSMDHARCPSVALPGRKAGVWGISTASRLSEKVV